MKRRVEDLEFTLVRSRRKTADIVVERDGQIVVRAPESIADDLIEHAVRDRALWVYRALAEWEDLNSGRPDRAFVQGSSFPYLGRSYRVRIVPATCKPLTLRNGRFELSEAILEAGGPPAARKAFRDFYQEKGLRLLGERVSAFAPKVGVQPGAISVRELGFHWASCGRGGRLNFHWKVMMAPATVIDYVVVHELCHLRFRDHSDAFWNEVDKILPRYRERKDWLRQSGASLDL